MGKINRRDSLKYLAVAGVSAGLLTTGCDTDEEVEEAVPETEEFRGFRNLSEADIEMLKQPFFTDHERETVRVLANIVIPEDDRSGNAEDAGTVEFIEFMMWDAPVLQLPVRGGLQWLDHQCRKRFESNFIECSEGQMIEVVEDIAYPETAPPEMSQGVAFFNRFRDLVATGFWTSKMGIEDLQYMGNKVTIWDGAPQEWLDRLGVSYDVE